jgi:hypothetical protein
VIIRIFRGSLPSERRAEFLEWARGTAVPRVRAAAGFRDLMVGIQDAGDRLEVLIATGWTDLEAELATLGDLGPRAPALDLPAWLDAESAEHFESIGTMLEPLGEPHGTRLRALWLVLRPNVSSLFFDHVRELQHELRASGALVSALMGRRTSGPRDEYASVALWRDDAALARATGGAVDRPVGWDELAEWAESYQAQIYDAVALELTPV